MVQNICFATLKVSLVYGFHMWMRCVVPLWFWATWSVWTKSVDKYCFPFFVQQLRNNLQKSSLYFNLYNT